MHGTNVTKKSQVVSVHFMKKSAGVSIVPDTLPSALDGASWSVSRPGHFAPNAHSLGSPRIDVDPLEEAKLIGLLVTKTHSFIQPIAQIATGLIHTSLFSQSSSIKLKGQRNSKFSKNNSFNSQGQPQTEVCFWNQCFVYIQGVPGGMCQTSGGCSLC